LKTSFEKLLGSQPPILLHEKGPKVEIRKEKEKKSGKKYLQNKRYPQV
jgi:hypothetical protein